MPIKTWVMLDSRNFTENERIYMPLKLEGPSAGGILRIRGTLLYSPPPPPPPPEEIFIEPPATDGTIVTGEAGTARETTSTGTGREAYASNVPWSNFFSGLKSFIAPEASSQSVINIWMGPGSTLVYSARHGASFDIAVPVNFFQDVVLIETACDAPPIGLGGREDIVAMEYSNPYELGVFAIPQDTIETTSGVSSTIAVSSTMPKLRSGYHSCFVEVVTHGNQWNLHIEMEYDYERLGSAVTYEEAPIIRNILINKSTFNMARIAWQTNVICDRNWVGYGIHEAGENIMDASTGSLTPGAIITMQDGTWYHVKVFSELKGRISNCEEFVWKMPDASVRKTADLTPQSNSAAVVGDGLQGDGVKVTDIEGTQELIRKRGSIMPLLAVGGAAVALIGIGGTAWWFLLRKRKG